MQKFAFINHFLDLHLLYEHLWFPGIRRFPPRALKSLIARLPPYRYMQIGPIRSRIGMEALGIGVLCPFLPEHFVTIDGHRVFKKIVEAVHIAERFGAKIVGLGGFTSVFGDEGVEVSKHVQIAVTSGNTYTAALSVEGLLKAAELMGVNISESRIAIIGATGDIGSICAKILAKKSGEIVLAARNENRLNDFANDLRRVTTTSVVVTKYVRDAVKGSDLILTAASAITTVLEEGDLKPGSIVCDVGYPANVGRDLRRRRPDILIFEGGLATWDFCDELPQREKMENFSPRGTIHGCLAETILLTLEEKFENFSLGRGHINEDFIRQILELARRHGFKLAPFHYGKKCYSQEDIIRIKNEAGQYYRKKQRSSVFT